MTRSTSSRTDGSHLRKGPGRWRCATRGFTLIELSVVLVAVGLLIGGLLVALSTQVEASKVARAERQLEEIREALLGFAAAHGRLPCPATEASDGAESPSPPGSTCVNSGGGVSEHGFVPARTLGLGGTRNPDGLLVDPWGNPYRYSVSAANDDPSNPGNPDNFWDFVVAGQMRAVGMSRLTPDLAICNTPSAMLNPATCDITPDVVVGDDPATPAVVERGVPVIFYSLGPDGSTFADTAAVPLDEIENAGELAAPPFWMTGPGAQTGESYLIASDKVFVAHPRTGTFDDLVEWISPYLLYSRMIAAGQLP